MWRRWERSGTPPSRQIRCNDVAGYVLDTATETFGSYVDSRTRAYVELATEKKQQSEERNRPKSGKRTGNAANKRKNDRAFREHLQDMAYRFAYGEDPPKRDPRSRAKQYPSLASLAHMR